MSSRNPKPSPKPHVVGREAFAAITAVEGLSMGHGGKKRAAAAEAQNLTTAQRRAEVIRAYIEPKSR
jgi:hypothetical protein